MQRCEWVVEEERGVGYAGGIKATVWDERKRGRTNSWVVLLRSRVGAERNGVRRVRRWGRWRSNSAALSAPSPHLCQIDNPARNRTTTEPKWIKSFTSVLVPQSLNFPRRLVAFSLTWFDSKQHFYAKTTAILSQSRMTHLEDTLALPSRRPSTGNPPAKKLNKWVTTLHLALLHRTVHSLPRTTVQPRIGRNRPLPDRTQDLEIRRRPPRPHHELLHLPLHPVIHPPRPSNGSRHHSRHFRHDTNPSSRPLRSARSKGSRRYRYWTRYHFATSHSRHSIAPRVKTIKPYSRNMDSIPRHDPPEAIARATITVQARHRSVPFVVHPRSNAAGLGIVSEIDEREGSWCGREWAQGTAYWVSDE